MTANALDVPGVILYHDRYQASSSAPTHALPLPLATLLQLMRLLSVAHYECIKPTPVPNAADQSACSLSETQTKGVRKSAISDPGFVYASRTLLWPFVPTKTSSIRTK